MLALYEVSAPVKRRSLLLADYADIGPGHYQNRTGKAGKARNLSRQLEALGYAVTRTQAARLTRSQSPGARTQPAPSAPHS
jgi:hypothetical protein